MQMENCYKILSILITVYFCFAGTDDTLTPGKTGSDTGPEVREEIVRKLNEESEKEVKKNKDTSDFELPAEICQPLDLKYSKQSFGNGPEMSFCKEWYRNFLGFIMTGKRCSILLSMHECSQQAEATC